MEKAGCEFDPQCQVILEGSMVGVYLVHDWKFCYVNPALAWMFGYQPEELLYEVSPLSLVHPADRDLVKRLIQRRLANEVDYVHYSFRGLRKNGSTFHCEVFGSRTEYRGKPAIVGTLIDITKRKEAERKLKKELKVSTAISEISHILVDSSISFNNIAQALLNHARSLTESKHGFLSIIDLETSRGVRLLFSGVTEEECVVRAKGGVAFSKGKDGRYPGLWGHALNTAHAFFTNAPADHEAYKGTPDWHIPLKNFMAAPAVVGEEVLGQIALANSPEDYNEGDLKILERFTYLYALAVKRHKDEQVLKESEEKYKTLAENSLTGIFIHQDGKYVFVNGQFAEMHGYATKELIGKDYLELIHPDDRRIARERTMKRLEGRALPIQHEIRRLTKDGKTIWCQVLAVPIQYKGKAAVMGNLMDITERKNLEEELKVSLEKLHKVLENTIKAFASTVEKRDPYTAGHQKRVAELSKAIALEMSLPMEEINGIYMAGLVHDIGKISVPAEILSKPGALTEAEFEILKAHPQTGYDILKDIEFPWPVAKIVLQHHERLDGSGYPLGIKNGEILLGARILGVADVVEAMASHRPYRPALGINVALEEISQGRGTLYDPRVADACLRLFKEKGFEFEEYPSGEGAEL